MIASRDAAPLLSPELLQRAASLAVTARRTVEGVLSGAHRSPHRGASVVFVEHREYRPGDDPRLLDWRAYARSDRHAVKRFEQETALRAMLVLDASGSMSFGTKARHGATLLAAIGWALLSQGDAAGALTFDSQVHAGVPARRGTIQIDRLARTLTAAPEPDATTDLATTLRQLAERVGRRGLVAIASDLLDSNEDALEPIKRLVARGHEVLVLHVLTPEELALPWRGPVRFVGTEREPAVECDPDMLRESYRREVDAFLARARDAVGAAGGRYVLARTDEPPELTLGRILGASGRRGWA